MSNHRDIIGNVYNLLISDETLLRLLHYPPSPPISPLDKTLDNLNDSENTSYWDIVDDHILLTSKSDDLEEKKLCRIYLYGGKTRRTDRNRLIAKREIVVDILCHQSYESDMRLEWIHDRVSQLIFNRRIENGLGRTEVFTGYDFKAPKGYQGYRIVYLVGDTG